MKRQGQKANIPVNLVLIAGEYHCRVETCSFRCSAETDYFAAWNHSNKECKGGIKKVKKRKIEVECTELDCDGVFNSAEAERKHFQQVHQKGKHKCYICMKEFKMMRYMTDHMKRHRQGDLSSVCPDCGKICANKTLLNTHKKAQHRVLEEDEIRTALTSLMNGGPGRVAEWKVLLNGARGGVDIDLGVD